MSQKTVRVQARTMTAVVAAMAAALTTMGAAQASESPGADAGRHSAPVRVGGSFEEPGGTSVPNAVTYDKEAVPPGSHITVTERITGAAGHSHSGTAIRLTVKGLEPHRTFGAHVHTAPCGAKPEDAGPHYQNVIDPIQPSTDPEYANPVNEVWLDFTTDAVGNGDATAWQPWNFRKGEARSVVIHEHGTSTSPGEAGTAGSRLACLTVPFEGAAEEREGQGQHGHYGEHGKH